MDHLPESNPFSTRFWRAGTLSFVWPSDDARHLCRQRLATELHLQIVGPHGTGKSTLIFELAETIQASHGEPQVVRLSSDMTRKDKSRVIVEAENESSYLILDGAEQLTWSELRRVRRSFKEQGLLITSHRSLGLTTLLQTDSDLSTLERLVKRLLVSAVCDERATHIMKLLPEVYQRHAPNMREMLFELYDVWQLWPN